MDRKERIGKIIDQVIESFVLDFLKAPYDYTLERDIHGQFYHRLLSHEDSYVFEEPYMLLHLEYPHDNILKGKSRGNVDLVILEPDEGIDTLKSSSGGYNKDQRKMYAFEFKLNANGKAAVEGFHNDTAKLGGCEGSITMLFLFLRDKTYTVNGKRNESVLFERLINKSEGFEVGRYPDRIYYVNAQTDAGKCVGESEWYREACDAHVFERGGVYVYTQDRHDIEVLEAMG